MILKILGQFNFIHKYNIYSSVLSEHLESNKLWSE